MLCCEVDGWGMVQCDFFLCALYLQPSFYIHMITYNVVTSE